VTMNASGRDKRGQGSAKATIHSSMSESGGVTTVNGIRAGMALLSGLAGLAFPDA
jgi:hypothetical protein